MGAGIFQLKKLCEKALKLQATFQMYNGTNKENKQIAIRKFNDVWGKQLTAHFFSKYNNAEDLIWHLDSENFELFVNRF